MITTATLSGLMLVIAQGLAQNAPQNPPPTPAQTPSPEQAPPAEPTQEPDPEQTAPADDANAQEVAPGEAPAAEKPRQATQMLDLRRIRPLQGDAAAGQTKSEVCSGCHGAQGIAIAPIFPNLAGQHAEYLYWQLVEYQRGNVPDSPMTPLVADLSDTDMRNLAVYYAGLPVTPAPTPATNAPAAEASDAQPATAAPDPAAISRGQALFLTGDPGNGIPPCQGCHGNDAKGFPNANKPNRNGHVPYALFPRLRGQQLDFLQARLAQYQTGQATDSTSDLVMNGVGHRLQADNIADLSAYLSQLGPSADK